MHIFLVVFFLLHLDHLRCHLKFTFSYNTNDLIKLLNVIFTIFHTLQFNNVMLKFTCSMGSD